MRMAKKKIDLNCCDTGGFRVEAIVSVDERGQMVLPKELRERAGITAGEKLAVISFEEDGKFCCCCLVKSNDLLGMVRQVLGPMMQHITPNAGD
jgi:AbrB family looped-hinge helix DNA binding protein